MYKECKENDLNNQTEEDEYSREFKHQHKDRLCYCCDTLQDSKDKIHIYRIAGRKYGSIFDGSITEIHLCYKCKSKVKKEWFNEQPKIINKYCEEYQFEEKIKEFVDSFFIVENQEYLWNASNILDVPGYKISREDWIKTVKEEQNKLQL